jgi:hypothetical protein
MILAPRLTNDLYHYTGAEVAVYNILAQGFLRLSSYEFTNDPQESRPRLPSLSGGSPRTPEGADELTLIWNQADTWLRRYVKVACLTQDFELVPPNYADDEDALRGWAHPALWAHYGARHGGVCLRFDREKLVEQFHTQINSLGQCFHGAVDYPAQRFSAPPPGLDIEQVREFGADAVVSFYIEKHHRELFFTKHHDWANENEFRLILNEPSLLPAYIDIKECLTGVILGDTFPTSMLETVHYLLSSTPEVELLKLQYHNGKMFRSPIKAAAQGQSINARRSGTFAERFQELKSAEAQRKQEWADGKRLTSRFVNRILRSISAVQSLCATWPDTEAEMFMRARAIPPDQYGKQAGVPGEVVEFQSGYMCVVENVPKYSCTLVVALAVQLLETGSLRFHGSITLEKWLPTDNEISELWRASHESTVAEADTVIENLVDDLNTQVQSARRKFDMLRSK